jgi:uncharacterized tellurite resistance protein B-like protein
VSTPESNRSPSAADFDPCEALAAIIVGAARADGSILPCEADRVEHTLSTLPIFRGHSAEALRAVVDRVVLAMRNADASSVIARAAESLSPNLRGTVFVIAVDVLLADGRLREPERQFMEELRRLLQVRRSFAHKVLDVLRTKNFAWSPAASKAAVTRPELIPA